MRAEVGISFIEVLVVALLLSLVLAGILPLLGTGQEVYWDLRQRQAMIQNARVAIDKIVRELRAADALRVVQPGLLRFDLNWGSSGDQPTVEYVLDASGDLQYRWQANWDFRRRISVRAQDAVAAEYAVALTFDHAALVSAGKSLAGGDDVRVWFAGTTQLDRVLDPMSAWNRSDTTIWFRLSRAIAAGITDSAYWLHYGNLSAGPPPANGDNVFLDYEDGTTLDGWTDRDSCSGTYSPSADGFRFTASSGNCHRQYSRAISHSDVEIFWGFWSDPSSASDGHQTGVSARRSDTGVGYVVTLADEGNATLRIRYWTVWTTTGGAIASTPASVTPGTDYYGRFYLVGSALKVKYWAAGSPEPAWMLEVTNTSVASGAHYGQVDGYAAPQTHRHRTIILRPRVALEPILTLAAEQTGTRSDALTSLAGPFRSLGVACFDAAGASVDCASPAPVRAIEVTLVAMDPTGRVPDITIRGRARRLSR